jgi:hypothetical protein
MTWASSPPPVYWKGRPVLRQAMLPPVPPHTVITPASLLDLRGTCTTLVLDVEPVFLEPLRQEVTLGPITLDMHAVPKTEHLLGTALCALARLQE